MALEPRIPYVLAIDVGNTHFTLGAVRGEQAYVTRKVAVDRPGELGEVLHELWRVIDQPRRVVACSVNPPALERLEQAIMQSLEEPVVVIGRDIPVPMEALLPEPEKVGADRLCCAAAAFNRLQEPCVVADFGTAVTIDCVNAQGQFMGGAILPGMTMQARALHSGTAQLPEVKLAKPDWVFGRNTNEAIIGGIVNGVRGALRQLVESYATELGRWPWVICTGGDAELVGMDEGIVQAIVPELCLLGVALSFYKSLPPVEDMPEMGQ